MFGLGLDSWNNIMLGCLAAGAVATIVVVLSQLIIIQLQKAEARQAAQEFGLYKLDTERKIADANALGEAAKADVARAELKLAKYRRVCREILGAPGNADLFVSEIKPFAGTNFDVGHPADGREIWDFVWDVEPLFIKAGWAFAEWHGPLAFAKLNDWSKTPHEYGIANVLNVAIR